MIRWLLRCCGAVLVVCVLTGVCFAERPRLARQFFIYGNDDNDLVAVLRENGIKCETSHDFETILRDAARGAPVLILADGYPERPVQIPSSFWTRAKRKNLKLYVEFPAEMPERKFSAPKQLDWARLVVSTDVFGGELPKLQILVAQDCHFLETAGDAPLVVIGRVAGYNRAIYGIPKSAAPILFQAPESGALVATTALSHFFTARYAPHREWRALWNWILNRLASDAPMDIDWQPAVRPAFAKSARLSPEQENECFVTGVRWYLDSGLIVPNDRWPSLVAALKSGQESSGFVPISKNPGDGTHGILEGYSSKIHTDGTQDERIVLRADCNAETAMVLAVDWWANHHEQSRTVAKNLLDFDYYSSDIRGGGRGDPTHPAFGLLSWGAVSPGCHVANYGDDNARAMLATMLASACLNSDAWDEPLLEALHANLRTTGTLGFRDDRVDMGELEANGWRHYHDAPTVSLAPHFEAYPWACYLWAYRQTGYAPFLDKAKSAIRITMAGFPDKWRWNDSMERAHMLLCLAWLVRLQDTAEHRDWAKKIAADLLSTQDDTGGLRERYPASAASQNRIPASNEAYGTSETLLIQERGDPVTDQLYVEGFALLGLHEASIALSDARIKAGEDRLADYLCRIQNRSTRFPFLNGSWFRAFDTERWECWASSADTGWGAWCVETGWAQAWTEAILGLRSKNASLWDLTAKSRIAAQQQKVSELMGRNSGGPWHPPQPAGRKN